MAELGRVWQSLPLHPPETQQESLGSEIGIESQAGGGVFFCGSSFFGMGGVGGRECVTGGGYQGHRRVLWVVREGWRVLKMDAQKSPTKSMVGLK